MGWLFRRLLRWVASIVLSAVAAWVVARIKGGLRGRGAAGQRPVQEGSVGKTPSP